MIWHLSPGARDLGLLILQGLLALGWKANHGLLGRIEISINGQLERLLELERRLSRLEGAAEAKGEAK